MSFDRFSDLPPQEQPERYAKLPVEKVEATIGGVLYLMDAVGGIDWRDRSEGDIAIIRDSVYFQTRAMHEWLSGRTSTHLPQDTEMLITVRQMRAHCGSMNMQVKPGTPNFLASADDMLFNPEQLKAMLRKATILSSELSLKNRRLESAATEFNRATAQAILHMNDQNNGLLQTPSYLDLANFVQSPGGGQTIQQ